MILKSYMQRLPSTLFLQDLYSKTIINFNLKQHINLEIILLSLPRYDIDGQKYHVPIHIQKKELRQTFTKEGQTIPHDLYELNDKTTINFIFELTSQSLDYLYLLGQEIVLMDLNIK